MKRFRRSNIVSYTQRSNVRGNFKWIVVNCERTFSYGLVSFILHDIFFEWNEYIEIKLDVIVDIILLIDVGLEMMYYIY